MSGRARSLSSKPMALSMPRAAARSGPSVRAALWRLAGSLGTSYGRGRGASFDMVGSLRGVGRAYSVGDKFSPGSLAPRRKLPGAYEPPSPSAASTWSDFRQDPVQGARREGIETGLDLDIAGRACAIRTRHDEDCPPLIVRGELGEIDGLTDARRRGGAAARRVRRGCRGVGASDTRRYADCRCGRRFVDQDEGAACGRRPQFYRDHATT